MSLILGLAALTLSHCLPAHHTPAHTPPAVRQPAEVADDEFRITCQAAAVHIANEIHDQATATPNPAETLDDVADALPEVMPKVLAQLGTAPDLAAVLLPEVASRVWAFTVVEHARAIWDPGYVYVLDFLVDGLKKGSDPGAVRSDVHRITRQLAAQAGETR